MLGELLYHLHRHVRAAIIIGGLLLIGGAAFIGYSLTQHPNAPSTQAEEARHA